MKVLPIWGLFMANAAWEMQPDTTFEEQQKEVASLIEEQPDMAKVMEKTMKNYARQCVIASLDKAAEKATIYAETQINSTEFNVLERNLWCQTDPFMEKITVYKESITNPENITLL